MGLQSILIPYYNTKKLSRLLHLMLMGMLCAQTARLASTAAVSALPISRKTIAERRSVKAKEKCEKEELAAKQPNLLNFFTQPKAASMPLTISRSAPIHGQTITQPGEKAAPAAYQANKGNSTSVEYCLMPFVYHLFTTGLPKLN